MARVDVFEHAQLQALLLGLRRASREVQKAVRQQTKGAILGEWQKAVTERASTKLEQLVLARTARVNVSNQGVQLVSANSVKRLSGGLTPSKNGPGVEFGADRNKLTTYQARSRKGKTFSVTRHTQRQFRARSRGGYAVFPAAAEMVPRFLSLWTQTAIRVFMDALDGKG